MYPQPKQIILRKEEERTGGIERKGHSKILCAHFFRSCMATERTFLAPVRVLVNLADFEGALFTDVYFEKLLVLVVMHKRCYLI